MNLPAEEREPRRHLFFFAEHSREKDKQHLISPITAAYSDHSSSLK